VKVVGDSEIYNFPIHHFVHFSSTFERKMCPKSPRLKQVRASRTAPARRPPRHLRHCASRGLRATRGRAPSPGCPAPRDASESSPRHASAAIRAVPPGARRTVRPVPLPVRAPTEVPDVPLQHLRRHRQAAPLFKGRTPHLARALPVPPTMASA
jgi:hypothetical protein